MRLNHPADAAEEGGMPALPTALLLPYLVLWAVLVRALFVKANIVPRTCGRCGLGFERRALGEPVCSCGR
jgi:hypothetical protein